MLGDPMQLRAVLSLSYAKDLVLQGEDGSLSYFFLS